MKKTRIWATAAAIAAILLIGGCGTVPYELTDSEQALIVNYAAHIVSKYNSKQQDGLVWVNTDALFETEEEDVADTEVLEEETEVAEEETSETDASTPTASGEEETTEEAVATSSATFNELFGMAGIQLSYNGGRLTPTYAEPTYYSLDADAGYNFLILNVDIANIGSEDVAVNMLSLSPSFRVTINGEYTADAETTFLPEDFSIYSETIGAGETAETVIIFQIPDTVTYVDDMELTVTMDGETYQVIL